MSNLLQVKRIVQAKWNKSTGSDSNHSQEELTQEAEKILKKTQSKTTEYIEKLYLYYIYELYEMLYQDSFMINFYLQRTECPVRPQSM